MEPYKNPIPVPDEHMRMVGIIAAEWEYIELMLQRAVAEIMELEYSRIFPLTTNLQFQTKCDIILLHARVTDGSGRTEHKGLWKRFTSAYEGLKTAHEIRSKYIHAIWVPDTETSDAPPRLKSVRTIGKKLTIRDDPIPIQELYRDAEIIWNNGIVFSELLQEFGMLQI